MTDQEQQQQTAILKLRAADEYEHFEFPKALYRDKPKGFERREVGGWVPPCPFETLVVNSADEQAAAEADGWRLTAYAEKAKA